MIPEDQKNMTTQWRNTEMAYGGGGPDSLGSGCNPHAVTGTRPGLDTAPTTLKCITYSRDEWLWLKFGPIQLYLICY